MLNEAKLPASFWALAVTAYVHVWNRLPTAPLPGTTAYTEWFIACKDGAAIDRAVKQLATHFKCRDLGATEFLLGVGITRERKMRSITLHQRQFILDILERYNMSDRSPVLTPMSPGLVLTKEMGALSPEDVEYMKDVPYLSCIGSLQYLASMTRSGHCSSCCLSSTL